MISSKTIIKVKRAATVVDDTQLFIDTLNQQINQFHKQFSNQSFSY